MFLYQSRQSHLLQQIKLQSRHKLAKFIFACFNLYKHAESKAAPIYPLFMSKLVLDSNTFTYKPSEEDFQVINGMLTQQAKIKLDVVLTEVCEAQFKLECPVSTTAEMASFLTFLDEIKERVRSTSQYIVHTYLDVSDSLSSLSPHCFFFLTLYHNYLFFFISLDCCTKRGADDSFRNVQSDQHILCSHSS